MIRVLVFSALLCLPVFGAAQQASSGKPGAGPRPLKALLICGGCCHDYTRQHKILSDGIQQRCNMQVDVWWTDDKSTNPPLPLFDNVNWANGYDLIIHDQCAAANRDVDLVKRILKVHEKTPAVHLHCAMHSFRNGTDLWFKHLGLQSTGHGPHAPIDVEFVDREHPIVKGMSDWTIEKDELYNNAKLFGAHPLAVGTQTFNRKGKEEKKQAVVIWTNETEGTRSFSMSIGHYSEGVADSRYLDLVSRGALWACGKLTPENQKPFDGKNEVTFVPAKKEAAGKKSSKPKKRMSGMPKDAQLVHVTASTVQNGHPPFDVLDDEVSTRWCAEDSRYPQWIEFEFQKPQIVSQIEIVWERPVAYQYKIMSAPLGKDYRVAFDGSRNRTDEPGFQKLSDAKTAVKKIRIEGLGTGKGAWCSIREIRFKGEGISHLWPADKKFKPLYQPTPAKRPPPDPYEKQGNAPAVMKPLTPAEEMEILKGVQVPDGFDVTVFAAPPAVNYPVFVAAAPDGTLFVSSDGNGSLGRDPQRGRVIRLKDNDGDGRADQTNVFCEVDAPRGLVWDHDRLYLMHPPHLSVFIDKDRDGVADEQKILVSNLAFGYDKRPADHTTNGLSLGVDGYLYVAGGDFGFIDAVGTDGTRLTHRGGGVIRVRPDGTGLEIYSTGTRNILEVAVSPEMELFARDNTNDGGGWDVRFHHFTGGDDHGYPRLYKNFSEECIAPLADYGGGSGCGAVYVDEPGFGDWNHAPFSADWGTGALFQHSVEPSGATYRETKAPRKFVELTRPTDADVDGLSQLYCASWKGATFKWEGANVGFIVQVRPKDFDPDPLPSFTEISNDELVHLFDSPSYRRRLEAQRELLRRGDSRHSLLLEKGLQRRTELRTLIHDIQNGMSNESLIDVTGHSDDLVQHTAKRELASRVIANGGSQLLPAIWDKIDSNALKGGAKQTVWPQTKCLYGALGMVHQTGVVEGLIRRLETENDLQKNDILKTLCRLYFREAQWDGRSWGTRPDTRGPLYQPVLWDGSPLIAKALQAELADSDTKMVAFLIDVMGRHRMVSGALQEQIVSLARGNAELIEPALKVLGGAEKLSPNVFALLDQVMSRPETPLSVISQSVDILVRLNQPGIAGKMLVALRKLAGDNVLESEAKRLARLCGQSRAVTDHFDEVLDSFVQGSDVWTASLVISVADKKNAPPQTRGSAKMAITEQWTDPQQRILLIRAAAMLGNHSLDDWIVDALDDQDREVAAVAGSASAILKLKPRKDTTPPMASLELEQAISQALTTQGEVGQGEVVFAKANCIACHTVEKGQKPIGPFLGNISKTYRRRELAEAILDPSKTIAQGFKTNVILDVDGRLLTGYVTEESADRVVMRDKDGQQWVQEKEAIESRKESLVSCMPKGLMDRYTLFDFVSLLDYLESLSQP